MNVGKLGEDIASDYIRKRLYSILFRNYSFNKFGEIDIIAKNTSEILFIEVKTRTNSKYGAPIESVNLSKLKKLYKTVDYFYLNEGKLYTNFSRRFMVLDIILNRSDPIITEYTL